MNPSAIGEHYELDVIVEPGVIVELGSVIEPRPSTIIIEPIAEFGAALSGPSGADGLHFALYILDYIIGARSPATVHA